MDCRDPGIQDVACLETYGDETQLLMDSHKSETSKAFKMDNFLLFSHFFHNSYAFSPSFSGTISVAPGSAKNFSANCAGVELPVFRLVLRRPLQMWFLFRNRLQRHLEMTSQWISTFGNFGTLWSQWDALRPNPHLASPVWWPNLTTGR